MKFPNIYSGYSVGTSDFDAQMSIIKILKEN
jgi:hypothetical protein